MKLKPMLASPIEDLTELRFPVLLTEKVDGIRVLIKDGVVLSRSLKPIPSKAVQGLFGTKLLEGVDGEIVYGPMTSSYVFNKTTRFCMSKEIPEGMNKDEVTLVVFDMFNQEGGWFERNDLHYPSNEITKNLVNVQLLEPVVANSVEDVLEFQEGSLSNGYEGVMIRNPSAPYKMGRSTKKEQGLLKLKTFVDEEAIVIGFEERMHNANEATTNELGNTERSSHKENLIPTDSLGALVVFSEKWGEFRIGSGFTEDDRSELWKNREQLLGKYVTFKYFPIGVLNKPRFPIFKGVRMKEDMSV